MKMKKEREIQRRRQQHRSRKKRFCHTAAFKDMFERKEKEEKKVSLFDVTSELSLFAQEKLLHQLLLFWTFSGSK